MRERRNIDMFVTVRYVKNDVNIHSTTVVIVNLD